MAMTKTPQDVQKLSVNEVQTIREQNKELETMLANPDQLAFSLQDPGSLRKKLDKNRAILARDEKLRAKGKDKDRIISEISRIKEIVTRERPTREMMQAKPGTQEFNQAVRMNVAFQQKYGHLMARLKDLQRRLEPDDPTSGYLESARH